MSIARQIRRTAYRARLKQRAERKRWQAKRAPLVGLEYQLSVRAAEGVVDANSLARFAYRTRSRRFRDVLSLTASSFRFKFSDLTDLFRLYHARGEAGFDQLIRSFDREALAVLAELLVNQQLTPTDYANALNIFSYLQASQRRGALSVDHRLLGLEAQLAARQPSPNDVKQAAVPWQLEEEVDQLALFEANALLRGLAPEDPLDSAVASRWLEVVGGVYTRQGLQPLGFSAPNPSPNQILDSLVTQTDLYQSGDDTAPLVSVIMPAFRPGRGIFTSVESVLAQTHKNLEVIVVDDGSGESFQSVFSALEQMDARVRVIHAEKNGGAYAARNLGFAESQGAFITIQDDDDWSHGQKIELVVDYLLEHPDAPAVTAPHVRFDTDGVFVRIGKPAEFVRPSYAAIMYRREVFDQIGLWQPVWKAGDSEHSERFERFFNHTIPVVGSAPMSFSRVAAGRLTTGEISRGYIAPNRRWYVSAYRNHFATHLQAASSERTADQGYAKRLAAVPSGVPTAIRNGEPPTELDLLLCGDFTQPGKELDVLLTSAQQAIDLGQTVGFATLESPLKGASGSIATDVLAFLEANDGVAVVQLNQELACLRIEVHGPANLAFADGIDSHVQAKQGTIVVSAVPKVSGKPALLNLDRCQEAFYELFECVPEWQAQDSIVRDYFSSLGFNGILGRENLSRGSQPQLISSTR